MPELNVVIPMAGDGSRFIQAGYSIPKPLIDIKGKPMIQVVVENLNIDGHYIFLVRKEHCEKYNLKSMLNMLAPGCDVIMVNALTEGAACTVLLAKELINNDRQLLIANSDQWIEWDSSQCIGSFQSPHIDGGILTFKNNNPKCSYAKVDEDGFITGVKEKIVISQDASVGLYHWSRGSDFVKYAEQMIQKNIRVNGEFYCIPVYHEAIVDGKKFKAYKIAKVYGLGDPYDLQYFISLNRAL